MPRPDIELLTARQNEVLEWVKGFIHDRGMAPTVREIGEASGTKSSSVFDVLMALERKGYIAREPRKARSIVVLGRGAKQGRASGGRRGPRKH
jgi:repressor LexA